MTLHRGNRHRERLRCDTSEPWLKLKQRTLTKHYVLYAGAFEAATIRRASLAGSRERDAKSHDQTQFAMFRNHRATMMRKASFSSQGSAVPQLKSRASIRSKIVRGFFSPVAVPRLAIAGTRRGQ